MTFVSGWGFHCLAKGGYDLGQLCWPANFQNSQVCWSKAVLEDNSLSCFQRRATSHDGKDDVRDEEEDEAKEEKDSLSLTQLFTIYSGFSWPLSYSGFATNTSNMYFYAHLRVEIVLPEKPRNHEESPWKLKRVRTHTQLNHSINIYWPPRSQPWRNSSGPEREKSLPF